MLLYPVELERKAARPIAALLHPVVLACKAEVPIAVLCIPVVLNKNKKGSK